MTTTDVRLTVTDEMGSTRVVDRRYESTMAAVGAAVTDLLIDCVPEQGKALVVADAHYPFHLTIGLVMTVQARQYA